MTASGILIDQDSVHAGDRLTISFQRTLRVPDDGHDYPLPPGLGRFPVRRAADYYNDHSDRLPRAWRGDLLIPMYRREALWIAFDGDWWKPNAVKVGVGGVDAISGAAWNEELQGDPQNYLVAPDQLWLDGINSGDGTVRQFVAMPLGEGYTIEAQITGEERTGGIQIAVFDPLPGRFPDEPPPPKGHSFVPDMMQSLSPLGLGAGGTLRQKIYPDKYGIEVWEKDPLRSFRVHLISAAEFHAITGEPEPPTPVDAAAYTAAGFPWFELYDEEKGDLAAAQALKRLRSIRELEGRDPDPGVAVKESQVRKLRRKK